MRVYHGDPIKLAAPKPTLSAQLLAFVGHRYGLRGPAGAFAQKVTVLNAFLGKEPCIPVGNAFRTQ